MWWLIKMLSIVATAVAVALHAGSLMFTGESYRYVGCQSFVWVRGDTTKVRGVNVTSPCSTGMF